MNIRDQIKDVVVENCALFGFSFLGKDGNVDPGYVPGEGDHYLLYFDGNEQTVSTFDEVLTTPFVDGHSLTELADKIKVTDM